MTHPIQNPLLQDNNVHWPMQAHHIRKALGVPSPLPADLEISGFVKGHLVWIVPSKGDKSHRTFTYCPRCGEVFTCGNLNQHMKFCDT